MNEGLLDFYNSTTNQINGAFENRVGGTVKVRADAYYSGGQGNGTLTVVSGFVNAGRIWLTNTYYAANWYNTTVKFVVTDGTLVNDTGGVIDIDSPYLHNPLVLTASLDNRGTVNVKKSLALNKSGAVYTNSGTINVTAEGLTVSGFATFTNTSTGLLDATGAGVAFSTFTSLDNAGTIRTPGGALTVSGFTTLANSGLIEVGGGNFTLSSYTEVFNSGAIRMGTGRTLSVTGGTVHHSGTAMEGGALSLSSATLDVSAAYVVPVGTAVTLSSSSVNGTGSLTNRGTITAYATTFGIAALYNEGLLDFYNSTTNRIDGAFENRVGGTVKVRADAGYYDSRQTGTLTVASGFENAGRIWLTNTAAANYYATTVKFVVTDGTLVNEATGVIDIDSPYVHNPLVIQASLDNRGTVNVKKALTLNKSGAVYTNSGTINVTGEGLTASGFGTFTNTATGSIQATGAGVTLSTFTSLENDGTINVPGGALSVSGLTTLTNSGSIDVGGGNFTLSSYTAFENTGAVRMGTGRTLSVTGGTIHHSGTALEGGTLTFTSATVNLDVPLAVASGMTVNLASSTLNAAGGLTSDGTMTLSSSSINGAATLTNRGTITAYAGVFGIAAFDNEGLLDFYNSTTNRIDGAFENRVGGTVKVRADAGYYDSRQTGTLTVASGFENAGRIWLTNTAAANYYATTVKLVVTDGTLVNDAAGVIDIDSPYVYNPVMIQASIDNAGTINVLKNFNANKAGAVFHNMGTLNVSAGITFTVTGGTVANLSGGTLTGGTYNITGTWKFAGASIVTNAATIVLGAAAAKIVDSSNADALTALAQIAADGRLTLQGGRNLALAHALANAGRVTIGSGTMLQVTGAYTQTDGVTALAGGTLNASGGVQIQGGVLAGSGTITGTLTNGGIVRPGGSPGTLAITGNYTETAAGQLEIEIGGHTAGIDFDLLTVTGQATLAGTLRIITLGAFAPVFGDQFRVITWGSYTGDFSQVEGTELPGFLAYNPIRHAADLTLAVGTAAPGPGPTIHADPAAGYTAADVSQILLYLSEPVVVGDARSPDTYVLLNLGADRAPGGGDDVPVAVSPAYTDGTMLIVLDLPGVLGDGVYRLTVRSGDPGIRDPEGNALDGNANSIPGDDLVMDFVVDRVAPAVSDVSIASGGITIQFADAGGMNVAAVTALGNYTLVASGGDGVFGNASDIDRTSLIQSVTYNESTGVATLVFSQAAPDDTYRLTIHSAGVADKAGNLLGGGTDYVADLVLSTGPATVSLRLQAGSDTGASTGDGVTLTTAPAFDVTVNRAGTIVLDYGGGLGEMRLVGGAGTYVFQAPALAEGVHTVTAAFTPGAGEPVQASTSVTVDTTDARLALDGEGNPLVTLTAAGVTVVFDDAGGMDAASVRTMARYVLIASGGDGAFGDADDVVRTGRITSIGYNAATRTATLSLSPALDDERYRLTINADGGLHDLAGNPFLADAPVVVDLDLLTGPAAVTVDLDPASDSGASATDHLTNVTAPSIKVTVNKPGLVEIDFTGDGAADVSQQVAHSGTYSFASPAALADGGHTIAATLTPVLGSAATGGTSVTIDTHGPAVTGLSPAGAVHVPTSSLDLTFSEAIQFSSLGPSDVALTDPLGGPVLVTGSGQAGGTTYHVYFATQRANGTYSLAVGPAVLDLAGNPMDQNGDAANGMADDVFSGSLEIALPDLAVVSVTPQVASANFGQTITVEWRVRNTGTWAADASWSDRVYLATDDAMGGAVGLALVSAASHQGLAPGGEYTASASVRIPVTEGLPNGRYYLIVETDTLGGLGEADEAHNRLAAPIDLVRLPGPAITSMQPASDGRVIEYVDVSFDKEIDPSSLTTADVSLVGPAGAVGVTGVSHLFNHTYRISLTRPAQAGTHTLTVGPNVTDALGNRMDQHGDGTPGDVFTGQFDVRLPDLVVDSVTAGRTSAWFGESVPVDWLIRNAGTVLATGAWSDRVWLSADETLGGGDLPLAVLSAAAHSPLASGGTYTAGLVVLIPLDAGLPDGAYHLLVRGDDGGQLAEESDANNVAASGEVTLATRPGPRIVSMVPGASAGVVDRVDVTFDQDIVRGSFTTADVSLTDPLGGHLGIFSVNALDDRTFRICFERPHLAGTHTLTVGPAVTDTLGNPMNQNGILPNGEAADAFVGTFDVSLPDLAVAAVTPARTALGFGESVDLEWTVHNATATAADGAWVDRVWLSRDTEIGADDVALLTVAGIYAPVAGSTDAVGRATVILPLDPALGDGQWYLLVHVNATGSLAELAAANNVGASGPLQITTLPGPAVVEMTVDGGLGSPASGVEVRFSLTIDPATFTPDDVTLTGPAGAVTVTGVRLVHDSTYHVAFAPQQAVGVYTITIGPDVKDLLGHRMDQDGGGTYDVPFTGQFRVDLPNLVLDSVTPSPMPAHFGDTVDLGWVVRNADATAPAAGGWTSRVWLSADEALGGGDILLGTVAGGPLAAGASRPETLSVTLPLDHALAEGAYYILVQTDADAAVLESDEGDNVRAGPRMDLTLPDLPDLAVQDVGLALDSSFVVPGVPVELTWTVVNQGTLAASGTWSETLYLSSDAAVGADRFLARFTYTGTLGAGESATRHESVTLSETDLEGQTWFVAAADTMGTVFEVSEENNAAVSARSVQVPLTLQVRLPTDRTAETAAPLQATVSRNGPVTDPLVVFLSTLDAVGAPDPTEVSVPATVTIPAGERSAPFTVTPVHDGAVDGLAY
ncbi:MAG: Ig-like domain-containing protein, partial [Planctomycetota bacterium]|nr:Ig-like domain-containing protein [Planctomycetota bacterium]